MMFEPTGEKLELVKEMENFLSGLDLPFKTSNNGIHIMCDLENETDSIRLNIWATSRKLHVCRKEKILLKVIGKEQSAETIIAVQDYIESGVTPPFKL